MACKSVERLKQGARMWQTTDDTTEKWVAIGEIAGARAILPKETKPKTVVPTFAIKIKLNLKLNLTQLCSHFIIHVSAA